VTGKVREVGYDPIPYGNYLLTHGQGEHRSYMYAHMRGAAAEVERWDAYS
jgi:murein DD-endopeptidase MepM/ murein hydrolase activator NlpD